jgi:hypothetical protein
MGWGGTKLGWRRPLDSKSAIHAASIVSVFRPGDVLHVAGVHEHHREVGFQDVVDGLQVHAGRLHGDIGDAELRQPVRERQQVGRRRAEGAHLLRASALFVGEASTHHELSLADVDPGAALDQLVELFDRGLPGCRGHLPCRSRCRPQGGPLRSTNLTVALDGSYTRCRSDLRAKLMYVLLTPATARRSRTSAAPRRTASTRYSRTPAPSSPRSRPMSWALRGAT